MASKVKIFAPATVANVTCGFDVLGFAVHQPGDEVKIELRDDSAIEIKEIRGDNGLLPLDPDKNTVSVSIKPLLAHLGSTQGFNIYLNKKMPLGSGLGSSAASSVAGVYGANFLLGEPLRVEELLPFAMEGEAIACGEPHADNVAPALLGGFVLIRSYQPLDVVQIPSPKNLHVSIIHPRIEIATKDARSILKKSVPMSAAVQQWGNVAGLVSGLYTENYELIGRSMQDVIVEPVRSMLIPGFDGVKSAALQTGALGCGISGSGPSIFALSNGLETAQAVGTAMIEAFQEVEVQSDSFVSPVNGKGPLILEDDEGL